MQEINQDSIGPDGGLPPMPPKEGEMARPASPADKPDKPPKEPARPAGGQNWDLLNKPQKVPKEPMPEKAGPELAYKGNLREFSYGVKNELRHDLGKKLTVSQRAEVTKILSQRGGRFMGTRAERNKLREYAKEQGMPKWKERQLIKEAKNLKGKTRAA